MIRGILFAADELELALRCTLTGDTTRLNSMQTTVRLQSDYLNTVRDGTTGIWQIVPGIQLSIEIARVYGRGDYRIKRFDVSFRIEHDASGMIRRSARYHAERIAEWVEP